ncbi:hypothetical protein D3C81_1050400 [compost metagenome]
MPKAADHRITEGGVDHQQDRTLIDALQPARIACHPRADPAPRQLPGNKGHQQLQDNLQHRLQARTAVALHAHQQHHQQRRQGDAQQARRRCAADRRRDVAAGQRGEGNRRLHRCRQRAQIEHAQVQFIAHQRQQQRLERHAQQRKHHEGAGEHQQVQAPVPGTGRHRLTRQLGPVQEEQQADGQVGQPTEQHRPIAFTGQQGGQQNHPEQGQGEIVEQHPQVLHGRS